MHLSQYSQPLELRQTVEQSFWYGCQPVGVQDPARKANSQSKPGQRRKQSTRIVYVSHMPAITASNLPYTVGGVLFLTELGFDRTTEYDINAHCLFV